MMADTKITALTEDTTPASTDLLMTVDDPGGSPINKKATIANVVAAVASVAGLALMDDANAAAQLATLGTATYSEGTWTPGLYMFTIVGSAPAASGTWKRIGNLVFAIAKIFVGSGGNTSVASLAAGASAISGLPVPIVGAAVCLCSDDAADNLGTGVAAVDTIYPPEISAKTVPIYVAITYSC